MLLCCLSITTTNVCVVQVKCHQYYPVGRENEGDDEMVFNDVGLKVAFITERHTNYHFTTRVLQLLDLQVSKCCYRTITKRRYFV